MKDIMLPNWDLKYISDKLISKYQWSDERANLAIEEYKKYIFLAKNREDGDYNCPPGDVDEVWHAHILYTKNYSRDTREYFGYYLHHTPATGEDIKPYDFESYGNVYNRYFGGNDYMKMFSEHEKCYNQQCGRCQANCQCNGSGGFCN